MIRSVMALAVLAGVWASCAGSAGAQGCLDQLPPDQKSRLEQQRISLNLRDASIPTTMRLLAQQYRLNMLITDDVTGNITLDFFQVPARDVFQAIIDAARLDCAVVGNALRVSTSKRLRGEQEERAKLEAEESKRAADLRKAEQEAEARRQEAEARRQEAEARRAENQAKQAELDARGPVREETIRLRYADAETLAVTIRGILGLGLPGGPGPVPLPQLSQLYVPSPPVEIPSTPPPPQTAPVLAPPLPAEVASKGLTVQAYKPTNSIFIRFYGRDLERIKRLIEESLDIPLSQIQIAAQMVITTLNALEQIGVQWGGAGAGNVGRTTLIGQGFGNQNTGGIGPNFTPINPNLPLSGVLPVSPVTGVPTGGNLVNLPISNLTTLLPALAAGGPAGGLLLGLVGSNFNLNLAIQALEVQGRARTLAEPKAVTLENIKAVISRGFEVPFTSTPSQGVSQVQFKDALLTLEVTPRLIRENGENKIRMKVLFFNDSPDFTQTVAGNPSIFKRRQETEVVVRQGERLVIGGVTNDARQNNIRQVPLFGNIPVLGWLFKSRDISSQGEELIVILTPTVLSEPGAPRR
jgi:type IV pilus secretin PilQ/predicted competence protein